MLTQFDCIIFDADETLFSFDAFHGLQRMFEGYQFSFSVEDYQAYQAVNKPLWVAYQDGEISASELQTRRFLPWAERLGVQPTELNQRFLQSMAEICQPLDGAAALLDSLKRKVKLAIITNGFTALQQARLQRTGFSGYFDAVVISEQVGVPKPDPTIFEHTLNLLGNPPAERVLMVGDTPESDILGGIRAGMKTCWLDHGQRSLPETISPTWQVRDLAELRVLLNGHP
ncbi:pyrimidine 5'-nucleotidase [Tatumella saanichensis]|uniref:pyrimidine 5'-nucleotidase n=1 Tax=Tatumella saanichensis TaxID=480813 RepID=UPI0004A21903|nr:pyrimidine 5'-nucleotidase [Tatumella saanichensis]